MALTPGARLGAYEVVAKLGEGGMGQVYRATDTTLGRQVAIKILPDAFAQDPERLGRFEREAKTLASLNHPHIAAIYGFEKSAGMHALVMELVEGEDLSERIARLRASGASARQAGIPLDEALPIAKQIAEALEAAHEQGIIHRDLKPANIKLRADGTVKVLDFGLAKAGATGATGAESLNSPTFMSPAALTMGGMILGTAAYMAPEQARGKTVDKRADIWAFGLVLYEMLTGRQGDLRVVVVVRCTHAHASRRSRIVDVRAFFSPRDDFIAYTSQESGRPEVYVTTFPDHRQTWPLTTDGGHVIGWSKDGREILVATLAGDIAAYPVTTAGGFAHGEPTTLVRNLGSLAAYALATPDHSRLVIRVSPDAAQDKGEMRLLFGWQDGLRQGQD